MIKLGWIGVGNMGLPMALNLLKVGHELHVYNRSAEKTEPLTGKGAHLEETAEALAESADIIFVMLSDDEVVKTVFLTDGGMLKANLKGKLIINMSTVAPKTSRQLAELVEAIGGRFLEAPVSGSVKPAEDGSLVILCGGKADDYREAQPYFENLGKLSIHLGTVGAGAAAKLAINYFLAITLQGLAETVLFAKKNGIATEDMLTIINEGACGSPITKLKASAILKHHFPPAFALKHMAKDLRLALALGVDYPLSEPLNQAYQKALEKGLGEKDVMAIIEYLES